MDGMDTAGWDRESVEDKCESSSETTFAWPTQLAWATAIQTEADLSRQSARTAALAGIRERRHIAFALEVILLQLASGRIHVVNHRTRNRVSNSSAATALLYR